jgi:hypothetical protein
MQAEIIEEGSHVESELQELGCLEEITEEELISKIENGEPIYLRIIKFDLNPVKLNLPQIDGKFVISSKININSCRIDSNVSFSQTVFEEKVSFNNSQFTGNSDFYNCNFSKNGAYFIGTQFRKPAHFNEAEFAGAAVFSNAKFYGPAIFGTRVQFNEDANFDNSVFIGRSFFKAEFKKYASFSFSRFKADANFSNSNFYGDTNFDDAIFDRYVNFAGSKFIGASEEKMISFAGTRFNGQVSFAESEFDSYVTFFNKNTDIIKYAKFKEYVNFQGSKFKNLNLEYVRFEDDVNFLDAYFSSNVDFSYAFFDKMIQFSTSKSAQQFDKKCKITLRNTAFHRLNARWNDIKDHLVYDDAVYLSLINNFKNLGFFEDADNCYYQYRRLAEKDKKWYSTPNKSVDYFVNIFREIASYPMIAYTDVKWLCNTYPPFTWVCRFNWSKLSDQISWISCGYGVRVLPIILWMMGLTLVFALGYYIFDGVVQTEALKATANAVNTTSLSIFDSIYFSTMTITGKLPSSFSPVGKWKYIVMTESFLGYLLLALFVIVIVKKLIR